jgi:thymidylate kinase
VPINSKLDLLPYGNKIDSFNVFHSKAEIISNVKNKIQQVIKDCDARLVHECSEFENFSGRDIDSIYVSETKILNFDSNSIILHKTNKGSYRFLLNDQNTIDFINIDMEDINFVSPFNRKINKQILLDASECKKTSLKHFDLSTILLLKIIKYFYFGMVHSYEQLFKIKEKLNSLDKKKLNNILFLSSKYIGRESIWIEFLIKNKFEDFEKNIEIKKFWIKKREKRKKKRKVFSGKIKLINLINSKRFMLAFFFGKRFRWGKNHLPLPAISIIGNDGSGKTSLSKFIINNFSKMDPVFFSMKSDEPYIPFLKTFRSILKKIIHIKIIKKIYPIKIFLLFIGQITDLIDKFIKYKIGMAWADSGLGITIFERYVSDKIRGEFPNKKNKLLPLEQFFPLPDGFFYIDVEPETTLKRKSNDNHSLEEMKNKRENYLSLLKEYSEVRKISSNNSFKNNIIEIKNYIFELTIKKRNRLISGNGIKRCTWSKNRNRKLVGIEHARIQKDSFL